MFVLEHLRAFGYMLENPLISLFCEYAAAGEQIRKKRTYSLTQFFTHRYSL